MLPFGGSNKCPTCGKTVYAAEQVMGPGRKIYHKPCLKCVTCSRRLDSGSLLEHNQDPYCKPCHVKNFGTRDLRSANLTPSTPPRSPTRISRSSPLTSADSLPPSFSTPERPSGEEPPESPEPTDRDGSPIPRAASPNGYDTKTSWTPPSYSARPISPTATGSSTASAPVYLRQTKTGSTTDSPTRPLKQNYTGDVSSASNSPRKTFGGLGGTPSCPRCGKAVYFAEQVKASGRTWHKPCLRCTECSVLLDSTRLTEKDGVVMCRSCYSKLHGPAGSGYALLGRAG